jgi:hypothetical protein
MQQRAECILVGLRLRESVIHRERHRQLRLALGSPASVMDCAAESFSTEAPRPSPLSSQPDSPSAEQSSATEPVPAISSSASQQEERVLEPDIERRWIPVSEDPLSDKEILKLMVCLLFPLPGLLMIHADFTVACSGPVEVLRVDLVSD